MLAALILLLKLMVVASVGTVAGGLLGFRPIIAAITVLPALVIGCRALAVL